MNNQAAQTIPEPVTASMCPSSDYAKGWNDCLSALSQTAGVADMDAFMAKWEWLILSRCRDEFRADLDAMLAAAPAASGVHPDALPDGTLSKSTAKRVTALAAAPVSDRARYTEQMVRDASGKAWKYMGDADVVPLGLALELVQALTKQRATPQPSAYAVRELVKRWRDCAKAHEIKADRPDESTEVTEWHAGYGECATFFADELESLLSGGSHA